MRRPYEVPVRGGIVLVDELGTSISIIDSEKGRVLDVYLNSDELCQIVLALLDGLKEDIARDLEKMKKRRVEVEEKLQRYREERGEEVVPMRRVVKQDLERELSRVEKEIKQYEEGLRTVIEAIEQVKKLHELCGVEGPLFRKPW